MGEASETGMIQRGKARASSGRASGFFNLVRAEWMKAVGNYKLTAFLIWSYPVGVAVFFTLMAIGSALSGAIAQGLNAGPGNWVVETQAAWGVILSFPTNVLGRLLPLSFLAVVFAGEYEAATWKNIVPRATRTALVIAKIITPVLLVMVSLILLSGIIGVGGIVTHQITGQPYGPALNLEIAVEWILGMVREGGAAFYGLLLLSTYAALAAMFSRSTLGAVLLSFGLSLMDSLSLVGLLVLGRLLSRPELINLYRFTPTYNLDNVRSWLASGVPYQGVPDFFNASLSLSSSAVFLISLLTGMVLLVVFVFRRQDITA